MVFADMGEIEQALDERRGDAARQDHARASTPSTRTGKPIVARVDTTPGRMLLSEILPHNPNVGFDLINRLLTKKEISNVIDQVYRHCGQKETVIFCDRLMALGFTACLQGRHLLRQGRPHHPAGEGTSWSATPRRRSRSTSSSTSTA